MAQEVELKLTLSPQAVEAFLQDAQLGEAQGQPLLLDNQYFDTPDLLLNQAHAALRIRKSQHGYKQTLKSKGQAIAGLHQRGEWEYDIDSPELDWSLFPKEVVPDASVKNGILPLFKTDFQRHVWHKHEGQSDIELVLDQGVISSEDHSVALCEIELELKTGRVEDLFSFALSLSNRYPLVPCDINKAERGYQLSHPALSFFQPLDFSDLDQINVVDLLQETLTRISRRFDGFSQQEDWWSVVVISRQIHGLLFILKSLEGQGMTLPPNIVQDWESALEPLNGMLSTARTILALQVDDHSHSRGLTQRLLTPIAGQLNGPMTDWVNANHLGQAMLKTGQWLWQNHERLAKDSQRVLTAIQDSMNTVASRLTQMSVQDVADLTYHQAVAYLFHRFQHPASESLDKMVNGHLVIMGMVDALEHCAITDEDSRAKLASWARRLTVEQRHLQQAKAQFDLAFTF